MLIWILGILLFASLGFAGYTLGVIRVAFSFIGLLVASFLAIPLGHIFNSPLSSMGVKNPLLIGALGPFIMFVVILTIFKVTGYAVHRKIDVYYKYKAGDLRMGLWHRLSPRLGACVGMGNATIYLILISLLVYIGSYPTEQVVVNDNTTAPVKWLNKGGRDLQSSGMAKVAASIDPMSESYYKAADIIGLIYHNDLLEARLARYPAFLGLGEKPELQTIAEDKRFAEMRQRQDPFLDILGYGSAQQIINNPTMLQAIWSKVQPNLADLEKYLMTGQSDTFDSEKALGRWTFDLPRVVALVRQAKPNMSTLEMQRVRVNLQLVFVKTTLVVTTENEVFIKNINEVKLVEQKGQPNPKTGVLPKPIMVPTVVGSKNLHGTWSSAGGSYTFAMDNGVGEFKATIDGDRLIVIGYALPMAFDKEY